MTIQPVRRTVVLAAGVGSRIDSRQRGVPKPLIEVAGRPLLGHALDQARVAGCTEAVVVVGNRAEQVVEYLRRRVEGPSIRVVHNPEYRLPNGNSLLAAERWLRGRFYVQMADHLFLEPVLPRLARAGAAEPAGMFLLVDPAPTYFDPDDATRVRLDDASRIRDIGKGVEPWDAVDAGVFLLDGRALSALREIDDPASRTLSAGMRVLARRGRLRGIPLRGVTWLDVDTTAELARAQGLFAATEPDAAEVAERRTVAAPGATGSRGNRPL